MPAARSADDEGSLKSFTVIGRSKDGKERRIEPSEAVKRALAGEARTQLDKEAAPEGAADPTFAHVETGRAIVGSDTRVQLEDAADYPFSTIGFLLASDPDSEKSSACTASLIGERTIMTAASCVYDRNIEGGWYEMLEFVPGMNGDRPFGSYDWEHVYVLDGFITEYDGTYDSVWTYDLAIVELAEPVGEYTGWLGYRTAQSLGDFEGYLVGYHDDKELGTQWRSKCTVPSDDVYRYEFRHKCDNYGYEAWGAPIYIYQGQDKPRTIVGMNMGALGNSNWALRITPAKFEWLRDLAR